MELQLLSEESKLSLVNNFEKFLTKDGDEAYPNNNIFMKLGDYYNWVEINRLIGFQTDEQLMANRTVKVSHFSKRVHAQVPYIAKHKEGEAGIFWGTEFKSLREIAALPNFLQFSVEPLTYKDKETNQDVMKGATLAVLVTDPENPLSDGDDVSICQAGTYSIWFKKDDMRKKVLPSKQDLSVWFNNYKVYAKKVDEALGNGFGITIDEEGNVKSTGGGGSFRSLHEIAPNKGEENLMFTVTEYSSFTSTMGGENWNVLTLAEFEGDQFKATGNLNKAINRTSYEVSKEHPATLVLKPKREYKSQGEIKLTCDAFITFDQEKSIFDISDLGIVITHGDFDAIPEEEDNLGNLSPQTADISDLPF